MESYKITRKLHTDDGHYYFILNDVVSGARKLFEADLKVYLFCFIGDIIVRDKDHFGLSEGDSVTWFGEGGWCLA